MKRFIILFFILAAASLAISDENSNLRDIKNLTAIKLDKSAVINSANPATSANVYSAAKIRSMFGGYSSVVSGAHFANYSAHRQIEINSKVPSTRTVNGQALSSNITITTITGNAGTATALAANGANCSAGQAALGVDASGNSEGCWTPAGAYTLPTATSTVLGGVKPDGTSILNTAGAISATAASVGALASGGTAVDSDKLDGQHGSYYQTALGYTPMKTDYSNAGAAPTWNQNTTGSAATLTTARTINGVSFNGSANITVTANATTNDLTGLNVDNITATGVYGGYGVTGNPFSGDGRWMLLEVFNVSGMIWQRATDAPYGSRTQKIRGSADGGATWQSWI